MEAQFHNLKIQKRKFLGLVEKNFGPQDRQKILNAFQFADRKHKKQRRAEGSAYIIHPLRAAITLIDDVGTWDADVVCAALLHDVVEDCGVRLPTVKKQFGKRVADFVHLMTRLRSQRETDAQKETHKLAHLKKIQRGPQEVKLIKCADILDNLRCAADIPFWMWTPMARKKFPRWHREFHAAEAFCAKVHPVLHQEVVKALRVFDVKRVVRGVVRLGL